MMLDQQAVWVACDPPEYPNPLGLPYPTHEGTVNILGYELQCFQLSNGQRIFEKESFDGFMEYLTAQNVD
jgi:hypothetical protein